MQNIKEFSLLSILYLLKRLNTCHVIIIKKFNTSKYIDIYFKNLITYFKNLVSTCDNNPIDLLECILQALNYLPST